MRIYQVKNPMWLSDTFVFAKKKINDKEYVLYIKANYEKKIEEIGSRFCERFHYNADDFEEIIKRKDVERAKIWQRLLLSHIGDEFWMDAENRYVREQLRRKHF